MGIQVTSAASEVTVAGQTFVRVEEQFTWYKARDYCRTHYTDLANLESVKSLVSLQSILNSQSAWIGLFFDVTTGTFSWSSGPVFTSLFWYPSLSGYQAGFCILLKKYLTVVPTAETDNCSTKNAFICYYDPAIGQLDIEESLLTSPTTPPRPAVVQIGKQTFIRIVGEEKTWSAARHYCQKYYTDLANLQNFIDSTSLKSIASKIEAWIGLYFDQRSQSLRWSSTFDSSIPTWVIPSMFAEGQCAVLTRFANYKPQIYPAYCTDPKAFICFYDPSVTLLPHKGPLDFSSVSPQSNETDTTLGPGDSTTSDCMTTTDQESSAAPGHWPPVSSSEPTGSLSGLKAVTSQASSSGSDHMARGTPDPHLTITTRPTTRLGPTQSQPESESGSSSVIGKKVGGTSQDFLASSEPAGSPLSPRGGDSTPSDCMTTTGQEFSAATGHMPPAATSEPTGSLSGLKAVTSQTSSSGSDHMAPGPPDSHLTIISRPTTRLGPTQSQPEPESGSSSVIGKKVGGTSQGFLVSSEPAGSPLSPRGEQRFGILKADFNSSAILESEARKEQFLREIQEAVKAILGHEQFRLKWISFEKNQN
ncbi:putative C-type lectin domain family 20 member A [Petaurus breviceps papuanus]|uniref:putative C-type lectin domain family 20 member A n=1 Tax=Petaurus breviceps papuanus TaxID=3040969 RepID=UPI0036DB7686